MEQRAATLLAPWRAVIAWTLAIGAYVAALSISSPDTARIINDIAWTVVPLIAVIECWLTARDGELTPRQRRAWRTLAVGCACWLIGQLIWDFYRIALDSAPAFPGISQLFYIAFAAITVRALGGLSDSEKPAGFTLQHLGNLGLIACCLTAVIVITFLEPAARTSWPPFLAFAALLHCTLVSSTFFGALYVLWTQRWHATWIPMLVIVAGTAVYSLGNFGYVHALMSETYRPSGWVNAGWVVTFALFGVAAHLRRVAVAQPGLQAAADAAVSLRRSRQLEATIPALLIVLMVTVGMVFVSQLSTRVLVVTAVLVLLFAIILGTREAWIQGESQRLTLELRHANELLRSANTELQHSEARVKDLNVHLEERVRERTRQLQVAYEELEGFAYAVAHDLKAPLRAIDGFGHLLNESLLDTADETSRAHLARIRRSALKMAALIDDLLAYSRIERRSLIPQPIDLHKLIGELVEECSQEIQTRGIELRTALPAIQLQADIDGLTLVMRNLLANSIKFTRESQPARIEITIQPRGRMLEIVVSDNGIGFDMQYHDQIFKLFHRLHRDDQYQGTGIGLALVRKALERMRGTVQAISEDGKGAKFIVELPLIAGA